MGGQRRKLTVLRIGESPALWNSLINVTCRAIPMDLNVLHLPLNRGMGGNPRGLLRIGGKENLGSQLSPLDGLDIIPFARFETQKRPDDGPNPLDEFVGGRDRDSDQWAERPCDL